jgi:hypothetical protein
MRLIVYLYLTVGSVFSKEYVELTKELHLPFAPSVGLKLQFAPLDFSENPDYVTRLMEYQTLATGILTIEDLYYIVEDEVFIAHTRESATSAQELDMLVDQWIHTYGMIQNSIDPVKSEWESGETFWKGSTTE